MVKYKRVIVKVSGETFADESNALSSQKLCAFASEIAKVAKTGVEVGIVVGGGNFWRGRDSVEMDRSTADYIGMLATVMNALAVGDALTSAGVKNEVVSMLAMEKICETYSRIKVMHYFEQGKVVIFAAGTGSPYFSTDTAAALKACEIHADALLCVKNVDGIYDSDPKLNPSAKKYDEITFDEVIKQNLHAFDLTAMTMCKEFSVPMIAFGKDEEDGLVRVIKGEKIGTTIK